MPLNPYTLEEETEDERKARQRGTGELGDGLSIVCTPNLQEPDVTEVKSRAGCLVRPYEKCSYCRHGTFTLVFNANKQERYEQVACPRWNNEKDRLDGKAPAKYVMTEVATCKEKPFHFCPSCPSMKKLNDEYGGTDKRKEGWYSRYERLRKEELEDE